MWQGHGTMNEAPHEYAVNCLPKHSYLLIKYNFKNFVTSVGGQLSKGGRISILMKVFSTI